MSCKFRRTVAALSSTVLNTVARAEKLLRSEGLVAKIVNANGAVEGLTDSSTGSSDSLNYSSSDNELSYVKEANNITDTSFAYASSDSKDAANTTFTFVTDTKDEDLPYDDYWKKTMDAINGTVSTQPGTSAMQSSDENDVESSDESAIESSKKTVVASKQLKKTSQIDSKQADKPSGIDSEAVEKPIPVVASRQVEKPIARSLAQFPSDSDATSSAGSSADLGSASTVLESISSNTVDSTKLGSANAVDSTDPSSSASADYSTNLDWSFVDSSTDASSKPSGSSIASILASKPSNDSDSGDTNDTKFGYVEDTNQQQSETSSIQSIITAAEKEKYTKEASVEASLQKKYEPTDLKSIESIMSSSAAQSEVEAVFDRDRKASKKDRTASKNSGKSSNSKKGGKTSNSKSDDSQLADTDWDFDKLESSTIDKFDSIEEEVKSGKRVAKSTKAAAKSTKAEKQSAKNSLKLTEKESRKSSDEKTDDVDREFKEKIFDDSDVSVDNKTLSESDMQDLDRVLKTDSSPIANIEKGSSLLEEDIKRDDNQGDVIKNSNPDAPTIESSSSLADLSKNVNSNWEDVDKKSASLLAELTKEGNTADEKEENTAVIGVATPDVTTQSANDTATGVLTTDVSTESANLSKKSSDPWVDVTRESDKLLNSLKEDATESSPTPTQDGRLPNQGGTGSFAQVVTKASSVNQSKQESSVNEATQESTVKGATEELSVNGETEQRFNLRFPCSLSHRSFHVHFLVSP